MEDMSAYLAFSLFITVVLTTLWWWQQNRTTNKIKSILDVPGLASSHAQLGNLGDMDKAGSLHEFLVDLHNQFGPIASFWWGTQQTVSIASPELFKEHSMLFDRPALLYELFEPLLTRHSFIFANGPEGQRRHATIQRCYTPEALQNYSGIFCEIGEAYAAKYQSASAADTKIQFSLYEECLQITIRAIARTSHGELFKSTEEINALRKHHNFVWGEMEKRLGGEISSADCQRMKEFERSKVELNNLISRAFEKRKMIPDVQKNMLIDVIMESNLPEFVKFADALGIFVAGFHTSGLLFTWTLYFLACHQEIQDKIVKEMEEMLGEEELTVKTANELVYLRQVLDETLRLSILTPYASRISDEEIQLGGYTIPPNIPVVQALGVNQQNEKMWPDPEKFDPDRFSPENRSKMPKFYFEPFGFAGKRKCPGYRFAIMENIIIIGLILKKVRILLVDPYLVVHKVHGLVTHPKENIMVYFEKRN